ncbi:MAG: hypothetical protein AAGI46_13730 [Planctomycetota bacterium]
MSEITYPPRTNADWVTWARNISNVVSDRGPTYGLSAEQTAALDTSSAALENAYNAATANETRSSITVQRFRDTLDDFKAVARPIVAIIRTANGVTDAMKREVGVRVTDDTPSERVVPGIAPVVTVAMTGPNTARVSARGARSQDRRGKPFGARDLVILVYRGTTPPEDVMSWPTYTISGRTDVDCYWPDLVSEETVWFSCYWSGSYRQTSPFSVPMSLRLPGIGGQAQTLDELRSDDESPDMKIAA